MSSTNTNTESSTTVTTGPTISNVDTTPTPPPPAPRITSHEDHIAWLRQINNTRNTSIDQFVLDQLPPKIVRQNAYERDT